MERGYQVCTLLLHHRATFIVMMKCSQIILVGDRYSVNNVVNIVFS